MPLERRHISANKQITVECTNITSAQWSLLLRTAIVVRRLALPSLTPTPSINNLYNFQAPPPLSSLPPPGPVSANSPGVVSFRIKDFELM